MSGNGSKFEIVPMTLTALAALLHPDTSLLIVRRLAHHECECVAGGAVREIWSTRCMEVCGDNVVERITISTMDKWPEIWPDESASILVVTIGKGRTKAAGVADTGVFRATGKEAGQCLKSCQ